MTKGENILLTSALYMGFLLILFSGCGVNDETVGVGPVKEVKIEAQIDEKLVNQGKQVFDIKCAMCHKLDSKLIGPPLLNVTKKRKPEWIMNMILNPGEMTKENSEAAKLLSEYKLPMVQQNLTQSEARAIYEYFRSIDK